MIQHAKPALAAAIIAAAASLTAPAAAQVNGIATADTAVAVAGTQAFQTGYQQIATQYEPQRQTLDQRQQQRQQLVQALDTNSDGQLDETEAAAAPEATVQQVQALDQEIQTIQNPIQLARLYVVSQVAQQYGAAVQQVISDRSIQMMISPEAIIYAPDAANVTQAITEALNTRVPSATTTVPEGWQPTQATVNLYQQIQQLLVMSAMQQQQAAAQQQGGAAAPAPAQPPVEGR
jgi:Skp family chaperone for outer membrane proteins